MLQQIHQFRSEKDFAVQHTQSENLEHLEEEMLAKIMEWAPAESRLRGGAEKKTGWPRAVP